MTLRIGQIEYANCTPIFSALQRNFDCSAYLFVKGFPSKLNRMLSDGKIDLCPSSSIEYARSASKYFILPDLSISANGPVKSVILFSRLPLEKLDGKSIGFSAESETSIVLLRIILGKYFGYSNNFESLSLIGNSDIFHSFPAVLLIGDTALKYADSFPELYQYDLGELWFSLSGLPFVFALWIIRQEAVLTKHDEVALFTMKLKQAKIISANTFDFLASECPESLWISRERLVNYWETISYDLSTSHIEGVKFFYRCAREMGFLEDVPEIRFFSPQYENATEGAMSSG